MDTLVHQFASSCKFLSKNKRLLRLAEISTPENTLAPPIGSAGPASHSKLRSSSVYFRWLAAPMKNSIGIESMKLIREA